MTVTIWPMGVEPAVREYLKPPPGKADMEKLIDLVGDDLRALLK